ncbi:hypothetical protein BT63DRAFT_425280 [Microthyrium microscopicum]|uniref:Uncharacterized protein n=1 Tax=Microthyrium microscopicum TaxID=703497 RepID=A0A6A6UDR0_9PEZI|nr:hypothetical protein BT63DRAFT_425280 [Microthyrium microscopicum]
MAFALLFLPAILFQVLQEILRVRDSDRGLGIPSNGLLLVATISGGIVRALYGYWSVSGVPQSCGYSFAFGMLQTALEFACIFHQVGCATVLKAPVGRRLHLLRDEYPL